MNKHSALLLLACFWGLFTFCQEPELQKLLSLPDDTSKVNKLGTYNKALLHEDQKTYEELAHTIIKTSDQLQYNKGKAIGYSFLGNLHCLKGNNRISPNHFNESLKYSRKANDAIRVAKSLGNLATAYEAMGKSDSAIMYRISAIEQLEKLRSSPLFSIQDLRSLSMQYFNLAVGYENVFEYSDKALSYYKKAEALARQCSDTLMIVSSLQGITQIQHTKGQLTEAYSTAKKALSLGTASKNNAVKAFGYDSYAIVLTARNEIKAAIDAASNAVRYAAKAGEVTQYVLCSITLSNALEKTGNYKAQIQVLESALEKITVTDNIEFTWDLYEPLAEANYKIGNYKTAYDYLNKKMLFKDSTMKLENNRIMADIEFKYQTAQKEKMLSDKQLQIAQKNLQLQNSRQYTFYSIGGFMVALLVAGFIFKELQNKKKAHAKQLYTVQQEKEIQLLHAAMQGEEKERSRIAKDLHDGVAGMLAAVKMHFTSIALHIGGVLQTEGYRQGVKLLDEATYEVRKTSHNLMPEVLLQHGLDKALQRYCGSISNTHSLVVQYDSWGDIGRYKDSFELSVYRIVQELLNNIVKHSKAKQAIVQVSRQNNILSITVEDNGIGFSSSNLHHDGTGLESLKARVNAINGKMQVDAEPGSGVSAYLEFEAATAEQGELV